MKKHAHLNLLNLSPGEKIVCVQRQHWHMVVFPLFVPILAVLVLIGLTVAVNVQHVFIVSPILGATLFHTLLFVIGGSLVFATYVFLFWYYQFYIITNKRIVHRRHFTFGGRHMDEVFIDATPIREIVRVASNPFFDLLHLEDVYVHFQRLERPEPFIFQKPMEPRVVESIMEQAAVQKFDAIE